MWDDKWDGYEDMGPAMFLPVVFVWHVVGVALYVFYCECLSGPLRTLLLPCSLHA
jgi:hypothetical protein